MENKYIAMAITESYVWQGFGVTEKKAKEALINQWNEFFADNMNVNEFETEYHIEVAVWIDKNGYMMEL